MRHATSVARYSSVVKLRLVAHGQEYQLAQISSEFVILRTAARLPPGPATIVMEVDGDERSWEVVLLESDGTSELIRTQQNC